MSGQPKTEPITQQTIDESPTRSDQSTPDASRAETVNTSQARSSALSPTISFAGSVQTNGQAPVPRGGATNQPWLGGYEIIDELGRGGMGVVYRAKQTTLNRLVAIKMLLAGEHAGTEHRSRFHTEAQAVATLQHPNIVQIYEIGEHNGLPFLSLEFVPGGSLSQKIAGKPQAAVVSARLVETIARAMQVAHNLGVVHRDLKPANILLASADHSSGSSIELGRSRETSTATEPLNAAIPKISDFGLAKRLEVDSHDTRSGAIMGSPSYMAPEQARGEVKEVGPLADVYAIGAILYELLTGRPPFLAATAIDTVQQVVNAEPVPPSHLQPNTPPDLETICLKCLQKDPRKRYATAEALADDLHRFQVGEPILARPVATTEKLWRRCCRNPGLATAIAAAILFLVLTTSISTWSAVTFAQKNTVIEQEKEAALKAKNLAQQESVERARQQAIAEKEAQEAVEARGLADENAKIASAQSTLAVTTIQKLILEVMQRLGEAPQTWEARKAVLTLAADGLKKVADKVDPSTSIEVTEWAFFIQNGVLFKQIGEWGKAHDQFSNALAIARKRVVIKEHSDSSRTNLARNLREVGETTLEVSRDLPKALELYREALALREDILQHPNAGDGKPAIPFNVRAELAEDVNRVAATIYRQGNPAAASPYFQRAFEICQDLVATFSIDPELAQLEPNDTRRPRLGDLQQSLIRSMLAVGEMKFRLGNTQAAIDQYGEAIAQREKLLADNPRNSDFKSECARAHGNFGDIFLYNGDMVRAKEHYDRTETLLQELAAADPYVASVQRNLGLVHYRLGNFALRSHDDAAAAKERFEKSHIIRQSLVERSPENDRRQMELMLVLAHCHDHTPAAKIAQRYAESQSPDNEMLVDVARCFAQCASAATNDAELERSYSERAFSSLAAGIRHGYRDAVYLESEPDFDPLRTRPEFRSILAQAAAEHESN